MGPIVPANLVTPGAHPKFEAKKEEAKKEEAKETKKDDVKKEEKK